MRKSDQQLFITFNIYFHNIVWEKTFMNDKNENENFNQN